MTDPACQPSALDLPGAPGVHQCRTAGAVGGVERFGQHLFGHPKPHAADVQHRPEERVKVGVRPAGGWAFNALAGHQVNGLAAVEGSVPSAGSGQHLGAFVIGEHIREGLAVHGQEQGHCRAIHRSIHLRIAVAGELLDGGDDRI